MINGVQRIVLVCLLGALLIGALTGCVRSKPLQKSSLPAALLASTSTVAPTESASSSPTHTLFPSLTATPQAKVTFTPTQAPTLLPTATLAPGLPTNTPFPSPSPLPTATLTPLPSPTGIGPTPSPTITYTPVVTGEVTYTVSYGDTLTSIAKRYNTTVLAIMNRNGLGNPNTIFVGQQLIIPVGYEPSQTPPTTTIQYTVKQGETLSSIARRYRTTVEDILSQNPSISDPHHVSAGTVLTITVGTAPPLRTHKVRWGETIYTIAKRYRVSVEALVRANGLSDPNHIHVGQVLIIPGAS